MVEDEAAVRDLTTAMLKRAGYQVIAFADGREALAMLEADEPHIDVLVSDVVMPHMSGVEIAERVLDTSPGTGVVLLSGYTAETLDLEAILARGAAFVAKPVSSRDLLDAIGNVRAGSPKARR